RPERFGDPTLRSVMSRITVGSDPEYDAIRGKVEGVTRAHPIRAVFRTRAGLDAKFDLTCRGVVGAEQRDRIRAAWWDIDVAPDVAGPMALLAQLDGESA